MNLEHIWQSMEGQSHLSIEELAADIKKQSKGEMEKLNRKMRWKIYFTALFTPLYLILALYLKDWLPIVLFLSLFVLHLIGLWYFIRQYRRVKAFSLAEKDVHHALSEYIAVLKTTMRKEEQVGLFFYPFSAAAGFFLSLLGSMSLEQALNDTQILITLSMLVLIITPLAHLLAKWMNKKAFSPKLKLLETRLKALDDPH